MTDQAIEGQAALFDNAQLEPLASTARAVRHIPEAKDPLVGLREFHGWTLNKLEVFENYLKMYRQVAGGGTFIDAFAGTGLGATTRAGKRGHRDGSSLIAAKSGAFSSLHLIEEDSQNFRTLESTINTLSRRGFDKIHTHNDDCNNIIPTLLSGDELDPTRPCFALLDQDSTQLDWDTIVSLATWKSYEPPEIGTSRPKTCKVELWILFNTHQAIYRLWPHDRQKYPESLSPDTLDRVFGGRAAWWDLWEDHEPASALVVRFTQQLRDLGYEYVVPQLFNDRFTGRPQYHMLHATDHPSAVSLMRWAKRSTDGYENQSLPGLESKI